MPQELYIKLNAVNFIRLFPKYSINFIRLFIYLLPFSLYVNNAVVWNSFLRWGRNAVTRASLWLIYFSARNSA